MTDPKTEDYGELVRQWPCPQGCVDGSIPHGPTPDGDWIAQQCQFCDERELVLAGIESLTAQVATLEAERDRLQREVDDYKYELGEGRRMDSSNDQFSV